MPRCPIKKYVIYIGIIAFLFLLLRDIKYITYMDTNSNVTERVRPVVSKSAKITKHAKITIKPVPFHDIFTSNKKIKEEHVGIGKVSSQNAFNNTLMAMYLSCSNNTKFDRNISLALSNYTCPLHNDKSINNGSRPVVTFICRNTINKNSIITMFTTMTNNPGKIVAFNNTLNNWAKLRPHVKPVLFVTPNITVFENSTFYLIRRACAIGWDVAIAPNCNEDNYPLLRSMYLAAYSLWESSWYGYANGDILFDDKLTDALENLNAYRSSMHQYTILVGRRHDVEVGMIDLNTSVQSLHQRSKVHPDSGADYFITTRHGFPWKQFFPLVIGRPEVDNYLLWFAKNHTNVTDIDCSDTILALHQGLSSEGWVSVNTSKNYNRGIINRVSTKLPVQYRYNRLHGNTDCMTYTFRYYHSPYVHLYKRKIMLRYRLKELDKKCNKFCCASNYEVIKRDKIPNT